MTSTITDEIAPFIKQATEGLNVDKDAFFKKVHNQGPVIEPDHLIKRALENIDEANPDWTYVASRLYLKTLYEQAAANRGYDASRQYGDFHQLIKALTDQGIYSDHCTKSHF